MQSKYNKYFFLSYYASAIAHLVALLGLEAIARCLLVAIWNRTVSVQFNTFIFGVPQLSMVSGLVLVSIIMLMLKVPMLSWTAIDLTGAFRQVFSKDSVSRYLEYFKNNQNKNDDNSTPKGE